MIARCSIHHIVLNVTQQVDCEYMECDPCAECMKDAYKEGEEDGIGIGKVEAINAIENHYESWRKR